MNKRFGLVLTTLLVASLLLAACGGGAQATQTAAPAATQAPAVTQAPVATQAVTTAPVATEAMTQAVTATEAMTVAPAATEAATETPAATEAPTQPALATGPVDCAGAQKGDEVTLFYQWSGVEEEQFKAILQPLVDACGIVLKPEASRDQALVDTRVKAGTPYDIIFFNIVQIQQYQDQLKPVTDLGVKADNYPDFWKNLGSVNGKWLGLPVKADPKSIIWYSPANFEALGYKVPTTWDELNTLVEKMVADGNVPWSMGFESGPATGWTGSDFIQDILLVQQGPEYVMNIISGKTPYNDAGVQKAYETYGKWAMDPKYTVGGAQGTLTTAFRDAIFKIVTDPPEAMMVKQSGFAGGEIAAQYPNLKYGTDYDFFQVPGVKGLQGGSDWMMAFSDKPAVKAIFTYLSSDLGGQNWAKEGFGVTPNKAGLSLYDPKTSLGKLASILANATAFTPDIGDSIPGGFGTAEWKAIIDYVNGGDLKQSLDQAAAVQKEALSK